MCINPYNPTNNIYLNYLSSSDIFIKCAIHQPRPQGLFSETEKEPRGIDCTIQKF